MGMLPTDADLERTIRSGVSGSMMPAFGALPKSDLRAVIEYIKALSPRWDDPKLKVQAVKLPEAPAWFENSEQSGAHVASGKKTFLLHCASCHGETGKGDGPASKGLKDVWGNEIVPADISGPHHRSGAAVEDLFRTVAMGLDGTPMVGFREALGAESIWDLVAYLKFLSTAEPEGRARSEE